MAKLIVICGHGAGDPGACGNGYQEAERVRVLGKRIKELGGDNVILEDINRNFYKDNGISHFTYSKDYQIIELHMDSASASARGAHVIINAGLDADKYDKALADFLTGLFPGRSQSIVKRNNLANPARALAAGYGYRLVEIGFISNAEDVAIFNANIDTIAKGILACFDNPSDTVTPTPQPTPTPTPAPQPTASAKYDVGTPVCTCRIWESSTDTGAGYPGDWQANITRVIAGARHPYLIGDGIGWTDDASIDGDPHIPGVSTSKPSASTGGSAKYSVGTLVCTNTLATSSTGGKVYNKGDWRGTITRVIPGAPYPYLLNDGTGWTNDAGIDSDPHTPR